MTGTPEKPDGRQKAEGPPAAGGTPPAPRRRGRPSRTAAGSGPGARERILTAARAEFAEHGYDGASIRGMAKNAGVDPALVHHYFGPKEKIFAAAVETAFAPALSVADLVIDAGPEGAGERMARFVLGVWEDPVTREPLLAILRSAVANETAAGVFRDLVSSRLMIRLAAELDGPDARLRSELAASHLVGVAMLRHVIKLEPLASADVEQVVAMVGPAVQRYLTGA
ncbi:TetR family transcriptional regulator [Streptomyces cinnamoneus]|uniref:TetR family transcriptional regulator n=1 Tax=Streptomyces cinnamoneus TaxID=53446 RepID=A0A2G1XPG9_STRCJ|nr:TetR family transcriptional regulator [Streptomyces cinnamoneus]PHQ53113.1 TetR family transcriptional regulator [Streptomyces cinnamoneus]PPT14335.1 TetR/AcrR family transcriptional regulator [Streptomyces cinnamoneus]